MKKIILLLGLFIPILSVYAQLPHKAPLYWSVYEYHILKEQNGEQNNYIPEDTLMANVDWVEENLLPYGYDMICMDGWGDVNNINENGYRTKHSSQWVHDFAWWSEELQSRDMKLGMYINPLWVHVNANDTSHYIVGTDILVSSLLNPNENAFFPWCQVDRPGAEEYVKGYIQYYADMGIKYLRVDFLSWYETGYDHNLGTVGPSRPHEHYVTALQWMREACDANGMYLSLVMPNLTNLAETEKDYGHLMRINEDTGYGGWYKFSDKDRGVHYDTWSQYATAFDGFVYWSQISDQIQLDGDFIRLNTFADDEEKKSVISLNILAGGPVTISDQYHSIGNDLWLYQNEELLSLNEEKFRAIPLSFDPVSQQSQIWKGQTENGDWIVGLFNRETTNKVRTINFSSLGIAGNANVRDLWQHANIGSMNSLNVTLPPHSCLVFRISQGEAVCTGQNILFTPIANQNATAANFTPVATATSGLPISYAIASGPATIVDNQIDLSGFNGTVYVYAYQEGDVSNCAALPQFQSFNVTGGHQPEMYVGGTFNSWNLQEMYFDTTLEQYVIDDVYIPQGSYQLKFANTSNWSGDDWGNTTGLNGTAQLTTGGAPNISFTLSQSAHYRIRFNDLTLEYQIEIAVGIQDNMWVGGTFNNWSLSPMTFTAGLWIKQDMNITAGNHQLKFANTSNWSGDDWGNANGLSGVAELTTGGAPNISFTIVSPGNYKASFNDSTLAYTIEPYTLGIPDNSKAQSIVVYPNPTVKMVTLQSEGTIEKIEIFDMRGRKINQSIVNSRYYELDVSNMALGIYLLKIYTSAGTQVTNLIKK